MKLERYFNEAEAEANESYHNAYGDGGAWEDFAGEDWMAEGQQGSGMAMGMPKSQPYIIVVTNTTTTNQSDIVLLDAYSTYYGGFAVSGASISYGISGVTYQEFLAQTMTKPFVVGLTYIQSSNTNQIDTPYVVEYGDASGNKNTRTITPAIDPYQQQTTRLVDRINYKVDGFTKLTISTLYASATVTIRLYPAETVDQGRALGSIPLRKNYGNPKVIAGQTLRLK